jgi:hypothetical protein
VPSAESLLPVKKISGPRWQWLLFLPGMFIEARFSTFGSRLAEIRRARVKVKAESAVWETPGHNIETRDETAGISDIVAWRIILYQQAKIEQSAPSWRFDPAETSTTYRL